MRKGNLFYANAYYILRMQMDEIISRHLTNIEKFEVLSCNGEAEYRPKICVCKGSLGQDIYPNIGSCYLAD